MPYMLLIHEPVGQRLTRNRVRGRGVYERMVRFADELKARGVLRAVESLVSQDQATRIKVGDGRAQVLDGPFAEAKEMVGGFFCWTAKRVTRRWPSPSYVRQRNGLRSRCAPWGLAIPKRVPWVPTEFHRYLRSSIGLGSSLGFSLGRRPVDFRISCFVV
jgi:hypothetical protein